MSECDDFAHEVLDHIRVLGERADLKQQSLAWMLAAAAGRYTYNFSALGLPIIQYPQDMIAVQELLWQVKPDLVVETGIARGGSLIMSASMLALLDYCEAVETGAPLDPRATRRRVLGIDIDIRAHNRQAIEAHPLSHRIDMIEGSSIEPGIIAQVCEAAKGHRRIFVCLDSHHTHDHVLAELEAYAPLTGRGSYCVVFDTAIEDSPDGAYPDRPWGKGNNPKTAVWEYLRRLQGEGRKAIDGGALHLEIDKITENKLLITVAPDGYLRRVA
jgi:cephalosporin hydroxylase